MKNSTYKIKTTSWVLWILTFIMTVFTGVIIAIYFIPKHNNWAYVVMALFFVLAFVLQRFISLGIAIVTLSYKEISIKWIKQYIFHKRPDRQIPLEEIEAYKIQPDNNFDLFKLTLKNGEEIRFWHHTFTSRDGFEQLTLDFPNFVDHHNEHQQRKPAGMEKTESDIIIKRDKTIFESEAAPFLAVFAIICVIALPILYFKRDSSMNGFAVLGPMAGAMFFLSQYYRYRKMRKK